MKDRCPICKHTQIIDFLHIPDIPIFCNVLFNSPEDAQRIPRGSLQLSFCPTCGHIFNRTFDPTRMHYSTTYENSLHYSPRFQTYAEELASYLIARYHLRGKTIVEIGAGQGDFLKMLVTLGENRGIGFDPSYTGNLKPASRLFFIRDLFSAAYAQQFDPDFICCRHVLEHIEQPAAFLQDVHQALKHHPHTPVFFEVPNMEYTLTHTALWDLIYEHCGYFTSYSLHYAFAQAGFKVQTIQPTFGDQFLTIEAISHHEPYTPTLDPITREQLAQQVQQFAARYQEKIAFWTEQIKTLERNRQKAILWGAGSKGVTFANLLPQTPAIVGLVDINPRKQGCFVSGSGHPILRPQALRSIQPDVIILMNPNYEAEIRATVQELGLSPAFLIA